MNRRRSTGISFCFNQPGTPTKRRGRYIFIVLSRMSRQQLCRYSRLKEKLQLTVNS